MTGATMTPTLLPELKMPVAKARSRLGNHSLTDLTAAGKLPPSDNPSAARIMPNPKTVRTRPCPMAAALQAMTAMA
jgi:hypothetical protein